MKLPANRLDKQLHSGLAPVYAVSGDDPLLCQEAADAIRNACRTAGFDERQVFHVDNSFDWNLLREAGASLSLFAEKRLIELRMPAGKPSDDGKALQEYLDRPAVDTVLLISLPRLDSKTQKQKWAKALIDGDGCQFVQIWPVEIGQFPQWLRERLLRAGLSATPEAIDLLAARTEGNLLAAVQEIEKLRLLVDNGKVDADSIQASVGDSARFDLFGLIDAAIGGEASHALRMLDGLRGEGVEAPVILWGLARELRLLASVARQQESGTPLERAISSLKPPLFGKRPSLVGRAVSRHPAQHWNNLLLEAQLADEQIKGQSAGDAWLTLSRLVVQMAGNRLPWPAS